MGMASWGGFSRGHVLSGNEVGAEVGGTVECGRFARI
jgi:hypothetical protein